MSDATVPTGPAGSESSPAADPIPIPEADARGRKARTVKIQDILAAHARALDVRLEEGMREIRLAMESAIRRGAIHEAPPVSYVQAPAPPPVAAPGPTPAPVAQDVARGLAAQTDERFQALGLRLQKIEDALRSAALDGRAGVELEGKLDAIAEGVSRVAEREDLLQDRFLEEQRAQFEDLTRRIGVGVAAVIRALQNELTATVRRLELTSTSSSGVAADEAVRLERTMMAIAEHHEAVLDERLAEIRSSLRAPPIGSNGNGNGNGHGTEVPDSPPIEG